jgi:single-stranded-DNA-specific exonuclease
MENISYPKGMEEISQRVLEAAQKGEKVIIFGDADLDGIASVVILKELFELINPLYSQKNRLKVFFPDREKDGYGLSQTALDFFADEPPAILFTVDCGITNFDEVKEAKKMGFEVIIIDHHKSLGKLPEADLIVDPKQEGETYPFRDFAAAGLVYKLAECTLSKTKHPKLVQEKLLELAALATLSDQMPMESDNREIVDKGISALLTTQRQGLLSLIDLGNTDVQIDTDIFQKIIAPLNSSQLINHVAESYFLLIETSPKKAKVLAQRLIRLRKQKRELISITLDELVAKIDKRKDDSIMIFEANSFWPVPALGVIASKLLAIYKKPVFLFKQGKEKSVGSARLPKEIDGVEAMASCKKLLEVYGGHAPACGCQLKNKNLDKFKKCLEEYFSKNL